MNTTWMEKCCQAGEFLYGVYPYEVLMKLYRLKESDKVLKTEIRSFINNHPSLMQEYVQKRLPEFEAMGYEEVGYIMPYVPVDDEVAEFFIKAVENGNTYAQLHTSVDEAGYLLKEQGDRPFYIPTVAEIEELTEKNWISNRHYEKLAELCRKHGADASLPSYFWSEVAAGREFMEAINIVFNAVNVQSEKIDGYPVTNFTMDELNEVLQLIQECYGNTNLRTNRGWTPKKLADYYGGIRMPKTIIPMSTLAAKNMKGAEGYLNSMGVEVDYNAGFSNMTTIGPHGEVRRVKVGRNDPCPCGSGKKYKKCCGR